MERWDPSCSFLKINPLLIFVFYTHLLEGGLVAVGSCDEVRLMRGNDLTLVHGGLHRDDGGIVRSEGGSNGQTEPRIVYEIYKQNNTVTTTSISLQGCC